MRDRKLNRLRGFDYSATGAYFVTICVHGRECAFGSVIDGVMQVTQWGKIAENCWHDLPNHYLNGRLDAFVVMPNHVHGIVWIGEFIDGNDSAENGLKPFLTKSAPKRHGLPEIIRGFKTFSSRRINEISTNARFQWQKSYHDRIIRNDEELNKIRLYIIDNPGNWQDDEENI